MQFINGITILLIYQLAGEISVRLLGIPVPGQLGDLKRVKFPRCILNQDLPGLSPRPAHKQVIQPVAVHIGHGQGRGIVLVLLAAPVAAVAHFLPRSPS